MTTLRSLEKAMHKLSVMRAALEAQKQIHATMPDGPSKDRRLEHIKWCEDELEHFLDSQI